MTPTDEIREKLNGLVHSIERLDIWVDNPASDMTLGEYEDKRKELIESCVKAIAATVGTEPDEATMLKLHSRMNATLLDMNEELLAYHSRDRENASSKKLIDCVIAAHQIIEDAATVGKEHEMHICKRCGVAYELSIIDKGFGKPRFCPNCGYREMYQ